MPPLPTVTCAQDTVLVCMADGTQAMGWAAAELLVAMGMAHHGICASTGNLARGHSCYHCANRKFLPLCGNNGRVYRWAGIVEAG